jgi:hypothetical protein
VPLPFTAARMTWGSAWTVSRSQPPSATERAAPSTWAPMSQLPVLKDLLAPGPQAMGEVHATWTRKEGQPDLVELHHITDAVDERIGCLNRRQVQSDDQPGVA